MSKLRIVLLYGAGHLGSALVLDDLAGRREVEVVGVVRAAPIRFDLRRLVERVRALGWRFSFLLAWQRIVQSIAFAAGRLWPGRGRPLLPGRVLAARRGIPVHDCRNVNDPATRTWIAAHAPDLVVSAFFPQILRPAVLALPRLGCLNVHPGLLPDDRGAMCYFWALRAGRPAGGVSVHWMDEGIDTGAVLARRTLPVRPAATQQRLLVVAARVGARLLGRVVAALAAGRRPVPIPVAAGRARYHRFPGEADFEAYFARRRFFRIRDVFGQFLTRLRRGGRRPG